MSKTRYAYWISADVLGSTHTVTKTSAPSKHSAIPLDLSGGFRKHTKIIPYLVITYINDHTDKPYSSRRINYSSGNQENDLRLHARNEMRSLAKFLCTRKPKLSPKKWLKGVANHVADMGGTDRSAVQYMRMLHALDDVGAFDLKLQAFLIDERTGNVMSETRVKLMPVKHPSRTKLKKMAEPYRAVYVNKK